MVNYLLRGALIGLLFGLPVGAVGTMTVQRTWNFGFRSGLLTGLGSSVADCFYAAVGAFGLTIISDFFLHNQIIINFLGGALILMMGIRLIMRENEITMAAQATAGGVKIFLSSFTVGITNPAAILTFMFVFSYFGISDATKPLDGLRLVAGVFAGTYLWWIALAGATCAIKKKAKNNGFHHINKVFGGILVAFSAVIFLRMFL